MQTDTDVAVIGAGPYGLSLGAYLRHDGVSHRIFGRPMQSWRNNMPKGMCLKGDGYASTLYDPQGAFSLETYCREHKLPYKRIGMPIPLEVFTEYGLEFQRRMVPQLEAVDITSLREDGTSFLLQTETGSKLRARRVVLAVGITHFQHLPPQLAGLPAEAVSHSYAHGEVSRFRGKRVLVVGAGASAVDLAAALADAGAGVHLMGRRPKLSFYKPEAEPRPLKRRLVYPRSGLGVGWRYVVCVEAPLLFRALPEHVRHRVVNSHLGPISTFFMRDKVEGRIPLHMSAHIQSVAWREGQVHVRYDQPDAPGQELVVDHLIAATGYKPNIGALPFMDPALAARIRTADGMPVLGPTLQTSVPGLHMVGLASANCFGPAQRFTVGAKWAAPHLARHLRREFGRAPRASLAPGIFGAKAEI